MDIGDSAIEEFELIYEGVLDDTLQTLQKLKGIFIADFELTVPEVQNILTNFPVSVKKSTDEDEIKRCYELLKKAGAKVLLVRPSSSSEDAGETKSVNIDPMAEMEPSSDVISEFELSLEDALENEETGLTFSIEDGSLSDESTEGKPSKVFSLDMEADSDLSSMLQEETQTPDTIPETTETPDTVFDTPLLDLGEEQKPIDTNLEAPPTPKNEVSSRLSFSLEDSVSEAPTPSKIEKKEVVPPHTTTDDLTLSFEDDAPIPEAQGKDVEIEEPNLSLGDEIGDLGLDQMIEETFKKAALESANQPSGKDIELQISKDTADKVPETKEHKENEPLAQKSETREIEQIEEGENQEQSELPIIRRTKRRHLWSNALPKVLVPYMQLDIVLPILIGMIVLGIGNWMFILNEDPAVGDEEIRRLLPDLDSEQTEETISETIKKLKAEKPFQFRAANTYTDRTIAISIIAPTGKIERVSLSLTTPRPPDLTPEEIVQHISPALWLREVSVPAMTVLENKKGEITGNSLGKVYIEDLAQRRRVPGKISLKGKKTGDFKYSFHIEASGISDKTTDNKNLFINKKPNGVYSFYISGDVEIDINPEQKKNTPSSTIPPEPQEKEVP